MARPLALELQQVAHSYPVPRKRRAAGVLGPEGSGGQRLLDGVSLGCAPGSWTALRGASGAGKTTLLLIAAGLLGPSRGRVLHGGQDLASQTGVRRRAERAARLGVVFQGLHLVPWLSAQDNVAVVLERGLGRSSRAQAARCLEELGLADRLHHRPAELSAGECRRVAVARALVHGPELLLADEPTGSLDEAASELVMGAFQRYVDGGGCLLQSTHGTFPGSPFQAECRLALGQLRWIRGEGGVHSSPVNSLVIAIDGPAASGKSSVARLLAERLELPFLNTGAMYRAVGLACHRAGVDLGDDAACRAVAKEQQFDLTGDSQLLWNGEPAEERVAGEQAGATASQVALLPGVREVLVLRQRELGRRFGAVAEGRDTTTVVFPRADFKFFLWASPGERGRRRAVQEGAPERAGEVEAELERRDSQDANRAVAPLTQAADAVRVETDGLNLEQVVERLAALVETPAG